MKKRRNITVWMLDALLTVMLAACGSSSKDTAESEAPAAAEAVSEETAPAGSTDEADAPEESEATEAPEETEASDKTEEPEETVSTEVMEAPEETGTTEETESTDEAEAIAEAEMIPEVLAGAEEYTAEDLVGEYNCFASEYMGYTYSMEEVGGTSKLTLSADGTGAIEFDGEESSLAGWTVEGNAVTLTDEYGSSATGTVTHGVITLDFLGDGSTVAHYAKEGTDTSWMEILTVEEIRELLENGPGSKTFDACSAIDQSAGVHMSYELHTDYLDANLIYEVNAKDGIYASSRTTQALGSEATTITFYQDGKVYNLYPADMTGIFVTETTLLENNLVGMDSLHQTLSLFYRSSQFTEETREYDGASYTVEVYPEGKYNGETAFYYDAEGTLTYVEVKSYTTESGTEVPASFYTIHSIDTNVDESVLDMSAYTIEQE